MEENKGLIFEAIINVMNDIRAIGKGKKNLQQGFMYRGVDDVMNHLQPALVKNGVFISPTVLEEQREERTTKNGGTMFCSRLKMQYTFYANDGSYISATVIGEAMDTADKATNKAMSIAYKYACFQVFSIPTEEMIDPDRETPEPSQKKAKKGEQKPEEQKQPQSVKDQKINAVKINLIVDEMHRTGIKEEDICARYKIKNLLDITEEMFPKIYSALKNTRTLEDKK